MRFKCHDGGNFFTHCSTISVHFLVIMLKRDSKNYHPLTFCEKEQHDHSIKYLLLCFLEESHSCLDQHEYIFTFRWTIPFIWKLVSSTELKKIYNCDFLTIQIFFFPSELRVYISQFLPQHFFSQLNSEEKNLQLPFLFCGGNKLPYFYIKTAYNKTEILKPAPNYVCSYVCFVWMTGGAGNHFGGNKSANKSVLKSNQYRAQGLQQTEISIKTEHTHTHTHTHTLDLLPVLSGKY